MTRSMGRGNVVRAVLHLCGLSNIADAAKELSDGYQPGDQLAGVGDEVARIPAVVSEFLQRHQQHEFRRIDEGDRLAAEFAVAAALGTVSHRELIELGIIDSSLLGSMIMAAGGSRSRAGLLSGDAEDYFDALLDRCCVVVSEWLLETDNHGLVERVGIAGISRTLRRVEAILAELSGSMLAEAHRDRENYSAFTLRYLQRVREQLDCLELPGLDLLTTRQRYQFSTAYVPLTVEDRAASVRKSVRRAADLLTPGTVALIVGEPGSGKSTLAKLVMTDLAMVAEDALGQGDEYSVPLLVKLRSENSLPLALDEIGGWLVKELVVRRPPSWQHDLLEAGRGVVVVDGLDEIAEGQRQAVIGWLKELAKQFPRSSFVLTSRPMALGTVFIPRNHWRRYELLPLDRPQIGRLVIYWHHSVARHGFRSDSEATREALAFLGRVDRVPELRSLCQNPLLLAAICGLAAARSGVVPPRRAELYRDLMGMLVRHRDAERGISGVLSVTQISRLLSAVAVYCQQENVDEADREFFVRPVREYQSNVNDEALRELRPGLVLDYLVARTGLLRDIPVERIDWSHKSFREYLAADYFVAAGSEQDLLKVARRRDWHEVVGWILELLPTAERASSLIDALLDQSDEWHDRTLRAITLRGASTALEMLPRTRQRIDAILTGFVPPTTAEAAMALVQIGPGAVPALLRSLRATDDLGFRQVANVLLAINNERAIDGLALLEPERLNLIARELGNSFVSTASADLAHRVLSKVPGPPGAIGLHLNGTEFVGALSGLSERYRIVDLRLDHEYGNEDLIPPSAVPIERLSGLELDPSVVLRLIGRLGRVRTARLSWPVTPMPEPGDDENLGLKILRGLQIVGDVVDLRYLRHAEGLTSLAITGSAVGALSEVAGGPKTVRLGHCDPGLVLSGATERLAVERWQEPSLQRLGGLASLHELHLQEAPELRSLKGLDELEALTLLRIDEAAELDVSIDEVLESDLEYLILDRYPYLGVNLTDDQLAKLALADVPPGMGASEVPDLIDERWGLLDLGHLTDEEIAARGWDDWTFWLQLKDDADEWEAAEARPQAQSWADRGYIVIDGGMQDEYHQRTDAKDVWFADPTEQSDESERPSSVELGDQAFPG